MRRLLAWLPDWAAWGLMRWAARRDAHVLSRLRRGGHQDCFRMTDLPPYHWECVDNWRWDGWLPGRYV